MVMRGRMDQRLGICQGRALEFPSDHLGVCSLRVGCSNCLTSLSMATEYWKEHELPGIHNQPEWTTGWQELPQGAAKGRAPYKAATLSVFSVCSLKL